MTTHDDLFALDDCFALMGEDIDFLGDIVHPDVPVLTYRWSKGDSVSGLSPVELLRRGREAMHKAGLHRLRWEGRHLRGDTTTGQRVKMTVLGEQGNAMYLLMTAGMPGTRRESKQINRQLAALIEGSRSAERCLPKVTAAGGR